METLILENGRTRKLMDKVFIYVQMVIDMKVNGQIA